MPQVQSKPYTAPNMPFEYDPSENLHDFMLTVIEEKFNSLIGEEADDYLDVIINDENFLQNEVHEYLQYFVDGHKTFINALMNTIDINKLVIDLKRVLADEIEKLINYYSDCDDAECDWSGCKAKHAKTIDGQSYAVLVNTHDQ
jgi:hypothetical protein